MATPTGATFAQLSLDLSMGSTISSRLTQSSRS